MPTPTAVGASSYFLKIDGIFGESTDVKHKNEIDVASWTWGETHPSTPGAGTGVNAGRVSIQDFMFTAALSKASPKLFLACAVGEHINSALLTAVKGNGPRQSNTVASSSPRSWLQAIRPAAPREAARPWTRSL